MIGIGRPDSGSGEQGAAHPSSGPAGRYTTSEQLGFNIGVADTPELIFEVPLGAVYMVTSVELFNRGVADATITFRVIPPDELDTDDTLDFDEIVLLPRVKEVRAFTQVYPSGYRMIALVDTPDIVNVRCHGMNLVQQ